MKTPKGTYVVLYDTHWPKTHKPTLAVALDFVRRNKVEGVILAGDQFNFDCISHHTRGKGLYRLPGSYRRDIETFDREVLRPLEAACRGSKPRRWWIIGNHERFESDLIEEQPELAGVVDHTAILRLKERGWEVVPLGHSIQLGKLTVIHGEVLSGIGNQGGTFPSKKAIEIYGTSVVAGHTHAPQSFAKISPVDQVHKHMAWIMPILGSVNPAYLRNRPTAWLNGFGVIELQANGLFNVYPVVCFKGRAVYGGTVYGRQ